jgi:hypothetical protein
MAALTKKVSAPEVSKSKDVKVTPISYPFWFGGSASCFATIFTHPLDLGQFSKSGGEYWLTLAQSRYIPLDPSRYTVILTSQGPITNTSHRCSTVEHASNVQPCYTK